MSKRPKASEGEWWYARMRGASALMRIRLHRYCGGRVWHFQQEPDVIPKPFFYGEEGVDFELVQPDRAAQGKSGG